MAFRKQILDSEKIFPAHNDNGTGSVFTKILILRISLILRIILKIVVLLRKILRIRIFLFTKILRITLILRIFLRMFFS